MSIMMWSKFKKRYFYGSCNYHFHEIYGFQVIGLVCDGVASNLALLKRLCGTSGQYGTDAVREGGIWFVSSSLSTPTLFAILI